MGRAIEFLIEWSGEGVDQVFRVSSYIRLVTLMVIAFGIGFTVPVLLVFLQLIGVLTPRALPVWRYAIVGIVFIAAAITPSGDPVSLASLSVPMILLYFAAIGVGSLFTRRRKAAGRALTEQPSHDHRVDHTWFSEGPYASLDRFQREACDAIVRGDDVVVAAPTGSGKTVAAEYALATALRNQQRAFYTTPLKALSNQKFHDLVALHGEEKVGLLTGDVAIHPEAPVVVMTTEVLRNMMYATSSALDDVGYVILDEVHFLQDTYRGPVWEEIIIHLDGSIRLVCLSATVSNAPQLAKWMTWLLPNRSHHRNDSPGAIGKPLHGVRQNSNDRLHLFPTFVGKLSIEMPCDLTNQGEASLVGEEPP